MHIAFQVFGQPVPQGSKRTVPIKRGDGSFVQKNGRPLVRVAPDNPRLPQWRQEVAYAARQVYDGELLEGPIVLDLIFDRPRPKGHSGARGLKPSAPAHPTTRPDTLKLARAVEDALTGVLWQDDAQIVEHRLRKRYGAVFCVTVLVEVVEVESSCVAAEAMGGEV